MAKAMRVMGENLNLCDGVVIVLDARCPAASYNRAIADMVGAKSVLYVLNKADLALSDALLSAIKESGKRAVALNATDPRAARSLLEAMELIVRGRLESNQKKGTVRPMRFLIAGVPNTGKSTLINLAAGGKKATTGDKAGVTRSKQWVKCGSFELLDTPGTMPPSCENQTLARRLAFVGSINDDILALDEIALALLEELSASHPEALKARYGIGSGAPLELLDGVCKKRGFLLRGGEYDYERGERALLDDFRKGRLGRIELDTLEDLKEVGLI